MTEEQVAKLLELLTQHRDDARLRWYNVVDDPEDRHFQFGELIGLNIAISLVKSAAGI